MFPRLPARATFVADTKNVSDFVQKHCVRNKYFPVCAAQETSWATMCPQQCVLVCQGLYNKHLFLQKYSAAVIKCHIGSYYNLYIMKNIFKHNPGITKNWQRQVCRFSSHLLSLWVHILQSFPFEHFSELLCVYKTFAFLSVSVFLLFHHRFHLHRK